MRTVAAIVCVLMAADTGWAADAVQLFNGKDLSGFYTFLKDRGRDSDPLGVFTVQDGALRISGEEWGCITSNDEFENYRLVVEFKWGEKTWANRADRARDSGVLIHSVGADGAYSGIWMRSIECQMIEGGTGDFIVVGDDTDAFQLTCPVAAELQDKSPVFQPDGQPVTVRSGRINWFGRDPGWKDVKGFRGAQDAEKPVGEWNRYEIVSDNGKITCILNGVTVNRSLDCRPRKGKIQIQSEGAEVFVRKIELTPLESTAQARRIIYNSDADNMFLYKEAPMKPEDVHGYVDEIIDAGSTTLFISPNIGMVMNYPSEVTEMLGTKLPPALAESFKAPTKPATLERAAENLRSLVDSGHDPLGIVVDYARSRGLETFVSFRLNEVHAVDEPESVLFSQFWRDHPEWRIGKAGDPTGFVYEAILGVRTSPIVGSWLPGGLNFAVPEVRDLRLRELRELAERYDIDGIDLDFQRFPMYFPAGQEAQNVATMTEWMRQVRAMTKEVGEKRGRPLLLSARIMARPEQNVAIGLDLVSWAQEGLLDFVTVSHYLRNDFALPVDQYKKLLPASMPVYGSIEVEPEADTYRRIARELWANGADGLMLFNFFTTRENGKEPPFALIAELADPAKLPEMPDPLAGVKGPILLVVNKHEDTMSFVDPATLKPLLKITTGPDPHELVITPDKRFAYISNYAPPGNTVSVIDLVKREHVLQIPTDPYVRIHSAALSPDGRYAYFTAGQTGYVVEIDTQTNKVTRGIPTHGKISHMVVVSPDGQRLYTANIDSQNVSVIDRASGELITQIPCDKGCEGLTFTPDGKQLWAANQAAGNITVIDVAENKVLETVSCPGVPLRIRFTEDGQRALVSSWEEKGEFVVLDVASKKELARLAVGNQPIGIEISPDGKRAFVTSMTSHELHVIDLDALAVKDRFVTGKGCDSMAWWTPAE